MGSKLLQWFRHRLMRVLVEILEVKFIHETLILFNLKDMYIQCQHKLLIWNVSILKAVIL